MAPLVSTIEIARSPEEVFAFVTDPLRFAEWQRDVVAVRMLGQREFATTRRFGGAERTMTQQIVRNDQPRSWAARGTDGPLRPHATVTVEPMNDGAGSRITFTLDFEGHGVGVPLVPLVRRQAAKGAQLSYRNLKKLLESGRQQ
ncbi:SRPBCC family protein [Saccharopolyspora sp. K220]|uniref:SRPBCC family protein n=1 Tax=Saccharopolyspora soli TaxID=2926618 RepID=UPI001F55DB85|nr:SRPBCC family protein [Saccharopolyspora soli]MCI2421689.1 SRPBCC family protein [Saccharopolyspora soli]